jgi:hypothetical protein
VIMLAVGLADLPVISMSTAQPPKNMGDLLKVRLQQCSPASWSDATIEREASASTTDGPPLDPFDFL